MTRLFYTTLIISLLAVLSYGQGVSFGEGSDISRIEAQIAALDEDHCEVPCGIYGDSLRISLMKEHIKTIEKGMAQITELSSAAKPNYNQLVRWVMNKEHHATEIQTIASQYFMHQRVKMPKAGLSGKEKTAAMEKYNGLLHNLHAIQVYAMKCKQSTDQGNVDKLQAALKKFDHWYFHGHSH